MNGTYSLHNVPLILLIGMLLCTAGACQSTPNSADEPDRPNVVWITAEDMDPNLGCYGDTYAHTPNLDRLAENGVRYTNAFASAPVCSPARSALITGVWPNSMGTPHLRNRTIQIPDRFREYPKYLREAGYYVTNNKKQDYNYDWPDDIWHDTSGSAHWRNRSDDDRPFFSVFNFMTTHQSQIRTTDHWGQNAQTRKLLRNLTEEERHDPANAPVPPYYPDAKNIRRDIAIHYDTITAMDKQVGRILDQLEADGVADETIVFFYSDHGRGMPRHKRSLKDSGMKVPLIIYFPEKYQHLAPAEPGDTVDRLVSFIDFPPTLLSLLGLEVPEHMDGRPFLGKQEGKKRKYVFGSRDRVDEVVKVSRSVRDERYLYIRNYLPHRPSLPYSRYSEVTPTREVLRKRAKNGNLIGPARRLMSPRKPAEALYDTKADPHQVYNLADDPEYKTILERMRKAYRRWSKNIRDVVLVPEPEMLRRARSKNMTIHEWRKSNERFPYEDVFETAELVGRSPDPEKLVSRMHSDEPVVRFWAATACSPLGKDAKPAEDALLKLLEDPSPSVRIAAAEAVANLGHEKKAVDVLSELLRHDQYWTRLYAGVALRYLRKKAKPAVSTMREVAQQDLQWPFLKWLLEDTAGWLENGTPPVFGFSEP